MMTDGFKSICALVATLIAGVSAPGQRLCSGRPRANDSDLQ